MSAPAPPRVLVAGIGNIFCGDDGFGSAVAQELAGAALPPGVEVADIGIRGVHLAYQLLDGYDALVLLDATPRGEAPGTVTLVEPRLPAATVAAAGAPVDAHGMEPVAVLNMLEQVGSRLGSTVGRVLLVGCEPEDLGEQIGLSAAVQAAVPVAAARVLELVGELVRGNGVDGGAVRCGAEQERGERHDPDADGTEHGGAGGAGGEARGPRRGPLPQAAADVSAMDGTRHA